MRQIPLYGFYPMEDDEHVAQPLASAMIFEAARLHGGGALAARYDFSLGMFYTAPALLEAIRRNGPGVCLFSNYIWNAAENLQVSRAVKELQPGCITVHGGPSAPKYPEACAELLAAHRHADVVVRGEGELTAVELLDRLAPHFEEGLAPARFDALEAVSGLSFLAKSGEPRLVRTADRPVVKDLDQLPSPYLSGFFDRFGWSFDQSGWAADGGNPWRWRMLILETNRGCPYGCTFCDWGSAILQKIRLFSLERVRAELEWMARHRVQNIYIADANFGILPRDLEVARIIAGVKREHGFPETVTTNYAKNGSERLPEIFRAWASAGIAFEPTVSIQTTDAATLRAIRRSNIKTSSYLELSDAYREMNLPVRVQLMYGLPGSTLASWKRDLQFFFDRLEDVQGFKTQLLPNSPMAEPAYLEEHRIRTDEVGHVVSCSSFTEDDFGMMGEVLGVYRLFHNFGVLKWFLLHLQWAHGIRAVDYMHGVAAMAAAGAGEYPELGALVGPDSIAQLAYCFMSPDGWSALYREVQRYTVREHGVAWSDSLEMALGVQQALMPSSGARMPRAVPVPHDFVAYVKDVIAAMSPAADAGARAEVRLERYPAGQVPVSDPRGLCRRDVESILTLPLWSTNPGWELECPLRQIQPSVAIAVATMGNRASARNAR